VLGIRPVESDSYQTLKGKNMWKRLFAMLLTLDWYEVVMAALASGIPSLLLWGILAEAQIRGLTFWFCVAAGFVFFFTAACLNIAQLKNRRVE
jgi:hypothetical protein